MFLVEQERNSEKVFSLNKSSLLTVLMVLPSLYYSALYYEIAALAEIETNVKRK